MTTINIGCKHALGHIVEHDDFWKVRTVTTLGLLLLSLVALFAGPLAAKAGWIGYDFAFIPVVVLMMLFFLSCYIFNRLQFYTGLQLDKDGITFPRTMAKPALQGQSRITRTTIKWDHVRQIRAVTEGDKLVGIVFELNNGKTANLDLIANEVEEDNIVWALGFSIESKLDADLLQKVHGHQRKITQAGLDHLAERSETDRRVVETIRRMAAEGADALAINRAIFEIRFGEQSPQLNFEPPESEKSDQS